MLPLKIKEFSIYFNLQGTYTFEYLPLKVGESSAKLILLSQELGHYTYELQLKAVQCPDEKPIIFNPTQLGHSQLTTIKFISYARQKTEYSYKVRYFCLSSAFYKPLLLF